MTKTAYLFFIISILFLGSNCMAQKKNSSDTKLPYFSNLSYEQFTSILKDDSVIVIDVRTAEEYQSGHLKGATIIDFRGSDFVDKINKLDKKRTYLLYCRSGNRSGQAMAIFKQNGFTSVYNQQGGIIELNNRKHPLEVGPVK